MNKTILLDLDGTLTNTMKAEFADFRDGKATMDPRKVPLFPGAIEFVRKLKNDGNEVFIISDSHHRFVTPIAKEVFDVQALSLAYKPATENIQRFIQSNSSIKLPSNRIFMVGDSSLDIIVSRKLKLPSIHIMHELDYKPDLWAETQKLGPTFSCSSFEYLYEIISNPLENLLVLEGLKYEGISHGEIRIDEVAYKAAVGKRLYQVALARQESNPCDIFARSDWYRIFSSKDRTPTFLKLISNALANYISRFLEKENIAFDYLSFVPDKATTVPPQKMELFSQMIPSTIPHKQVLRWRNDVKGSIRNYPHRKDRYKFVREYMNVVESENVSGKNIIVIDDQITTGATMYAITDMLWGRGANHILFISLFRMISEVNIGKKCPKCSKEMSARTRKSDGNRFYSCATPAYGGTGCGHIENFA